MDREEALTQAVDMLATVVIDALATAVNKRLFRDEARRLTCAACGRCNSNLPPVVPAV